MDFSTSDYKSLIDTIKLISKSTCTDLLNEKNIESIAYATVTEVDTSGRCAIKLAGGSTEYYPVLNKSITPTLKEGDCVIVRYAQGNVGNGYISEKMGTDTRGGASSTAVTSVDGLTGDVVLNDVKYTEQTLTTAQQTQAKTNLGVVEDKTYVFTQSTAATTWSITHNLQKYPSVTVVDSGGTVVMGEVTYLTNLSLTITFSAAFSGMAYLN